MNFESPSFCDNDSFCVAELLSQLAPEENRFENMMIFWFCVERKQFIFLGSFPIPSDMYIYFDDKTNKNVFFIKRFKFLQFL